MGRPATKTDLVNAAAANWEKLNALIASLTEEELSVPFDFTGDVKKKEAHWKRDFPMRNYLQREYTRGPAEARWALILSAAHPATTTGL